MEEEPCDDNESYQHKNEPTTKEFVKGMRKAFNITFHIPCFGIIQDNIAYAILFNCYR